MSEILVELTRGGMIESVHRGHAVICDDQGEVLEAWGDPDKVIFPRSSCKMIQALPLIESGAGAGLSPAQLALACASHQGARGHADAVRAWLDDLGKGDDDLRCGPQPSRDRPTRNAMIRAGDAPCRVHNNCSGKHAGFLTLAAHLNAGPEYNDLDHPVQIAVRAATEETCGETASAVGIDGCSAPNFAVSLAGLGRSMSAFATAGARTDARSKAMVQLVDAMRRHPALVAGTGRACTELMEAMGGRVAVKTGAEGVFIAILPEQRCSVALKIEDGGTRAAECAVAALLVRLGALDHDHPLTRRRLDAPLTNFAGQEVGEIRAAQTLR